ncbi:MAG: aldehyde ferredoxin oxidoreductase N-terminal domain-containing protein [Anaerosomatales bacterium]|nr:aldehyde ferredoxin oxidoreductase N-terminal domain-containing protein [Anaerosomatales bacterium]
MSGGYTGKILRINLTDKSVSTLDTKDYEEYGGGHGMGSAIFWDLCEDKTVSGFDPGNVITIMSSPLSGTLTPAASGRTEVQGIGVQGYPTEWFTRSNFGGRFCGQMKFAGWDGIVVEGAADKPVWVDIRDDDVQIKDAEGLWGLDTTEVQEEIWRIVQGGTSEWRSLGGGRDSGRTTQRPAVLTIGRAGETMSRTAALIHDAGNGAGQGGFGGVFGSKNLKAISVIGTGGVEVADPAALMDARLWANQYAVAGSIADDDFAPQSMGSMFGGNPASGAAGYAPADQPKAPMGCLGCHKNCRARFQSAASNGSSCVDYFFYHVYDQAAHGGYTQAILDAADLLQRYGINSYQVEAMIIWLNHLYQEGVLGKGKEIDTELDFTKLGEVSFVEQLLDMIAEKYDIGEDLHEGIALAAVKWGRYEQDTKTGILPIQAWGYVQHYDARTEVEWGYGSLVGDRDINEHDFNTLVYWAPSIASLFGAQPACSAPLLAEIMEEKLTPYNDPMMMDYSDEGIYSESMAKLVAWHRHYTRYYKQSLAFCDWAYGDFFNAFGPDNRGLTGEGEDKFFNAVTGQSQTFEEGMEKGRKIWNLDRAIWILQGRERDQEVFTDYNYEVGAVPGYTTYEVPYVVPAFENGEWTYKSVSGRMLDRDKVEDWKTKFYTLEGWDTSTGWPTRATLEDLGLGHVADTLEEAGKLGA